MAMPKITINGLSANSLRKAAKQVERYQLQVSLKNKELVRELTKKGIEEAGNHLTFKGDSTPPTIPTTNPHVRMGKSEGQMYAAVRLKGKDVAFVEFGAGIHYNTPVGTSPNPYGVELGYTIGSYSELGGNGYSQGQNEFWGYEDENGVFVTSYGTEAAMPLFHASEKVKECYADVAKSVFRS